MKKSVLVEKIYRTEKNDIATLFITKGKIYSFLNPVSYITALKNIHLFNKFDGLFSDGSLLVSSIKILYGKTVTRRSFDSTSLAPMLFSFAENSGKTIYIVASKQERVEHVVNLLCIRYPNIKIAGYRNGYFNSEKEEYEEIQHIVQLNPDFLIVGMGALLQERFLVKAKELGYRGIGFTCGGYIHQTSINEIYYYPTWIDKLNLRFIYRMYKEPHTRKRYLQAALIFPVKFILERFTG